MTKADASAGSVDPEDRTAAIEREIDELLADANGDARAAIRALLHDFEALLRDALAATSKGYVRGRFVRTVRE